MPGTNSLTLPDMVRLMEKLATNFGGKKDLEAKADLWLEKLERYPLDVVERVISRLLTEPHQYFPQVGHALALAREMAPEVAGPPDQLRAKYRQWEADPWATIGSLDDDPLRCTSAPCPVCGSVIQFSPRGAVIVHDDLRHKEAQLGYSNIGRPEWWQLGPLPPLQKPALEVTP